MRTFKISGMTCSGCENAVAKAIKQRLGEDTTVEADAGKGEVRVSESVDPQIVVFAIASAGYSVESVSG